MNTGPVNIGPVNIGALKAQVSPAGARIRHVAV